MQSTVSFEPRIHPMLAGATSQQSAALQEAFVCRVPALSIEHLTALSSPAVARAQEELADFGRALLAEKDGLLEDLYRKVGQTADHRERTRLIHLRRAVFKLDAGAIKKGRKGCAPFLERALDSILRRIAERDALVAQHNQLWETESLRVHEAFCNQLKNGELRSGLALATPVLHSQLDRYLFLPGAAMRSRDVKLERGLLRYFTRSAAKATPFARFCTIIPGATLQAINRPLLHFEGDIFDRLGVTRLNKRIFGRLVTFLLREPAYRDQFPFGLNRTLRLVDGAFVFLTRVDAKEALQRVPATESLQSVVERIADAGTLSLAEIKQLVATEYPDDDPAAAGQYVDRLTDLGLLRPNLGIPDHEAEWAPVLAALLREMDGELCRLLEDELEQLIKDQQVFVEALPGSRAEALSAAKTTVERIEERCNIKLALGRDLVFYEDVTSPAQARLNLTPALESAVETFRDYVQATSHVAFPHSGQQRLLRTFDELYGESTESVPLIRFYEDYYRADATRDADNKSKRKRTQTHVSPQSKLIADLWNQDRDTAQLDVSLDQLSSTISSKAVERPHAFQVSAFANVLSAERPGACALLIPSGQYYSGYGKYFSRFLHLFPPSFQERLVERNGFHDDCILAEIGGDDDFNANLHPPLTPISIEYPTADDPGEVSFLKVTDLIVAADRTAQQLELRDVTSSRRVIALDLGFLNPLMRPPLFRLLSWFSTPQRFGVALPMTPKDMNLDDNAPCILVRPRITLGGSVVIGRRQWRVPDVLLPHRQPKETWASYALRLNEWRSAAGIPEKCFVRVHAQIPPAKEGNKPPARPSSKPQYVDFHSPLLVRLLDRIAPRHLRHSITFEERLPGVADSVVTPAGSFAPELVLQFNVE